MWQFFLHDVNAFGITVICLAVLNNMANDTAIIYFSLPFLLTKLIKYIRERNIMMIAHDLLALSLYGLTIYNRNHPSNTLLHMPARCLLIEVSVLFLNHWKRKPTSQIRYWMVVVGYGLNRPVYLGWLAWFSTTLQAGLALHDPASLFMIILARILHIALCIWYLNLLRKGPPKIEDDEKKKDD